MAGQQRLVNKQFNSPIGLYSESNVREILDRESQMLANGAVGYDFILLFSGAHYIRNNSNVYTDVSNDCFYWFYVFVPILWCELLTTARHAANKCIFGCLHSFMCVFPCLESTFIIPSQASLPTCKTRPCCACSKRKNLGNAMDNPQVTKKCLNVYLVSLHHSCSKTFLVI